MNAIEVLARRAAKVQVYATMSSAVDATDQQAAAMNGRATSALARVSAATSFVDPELLSIGEAKLRGWIQDDSRLKLYEHYFNDLFRKQAHVRSAEVEELLGMLRDPFVSTRNTTNIATLTQANQPLHDISLPRRSLRECLAEELRRLDPDDLYGEVVQNGLGQLDGEPTTAERNPR